MKNNVCFLIASLVLITASCQREGRVTGVRLDYNEVTLYVGEYLDLTATVTPFDATNNTVYWTSSDPNKVSVSNGRITGKTTTDRNPVNIRVSTMEGEFEDWCSVTVLNGGLSFNDIKQSTYTANGTLFTNIATLWKGEVYQGVDDYGQYYEITNWANQGCNLWLDYDNGALILDERNKVGEDGIYDLYFGASYFIEGDQWYAVNDYTVIYNKTTQRLDFSGTFNGYPVYVGIFRKNRYTGAESVEHLNTQVRDAKLDLSPSTFSSLLSVRSFSPETSRKSLSSIGTVNSTATRSQPENASSRIVRSR